MRKIDEQIIEKIMDKAIDIDKSSKEKCRDFRIMEADDRKEVLLLRWTTIDISNIDNPIQCYHYQCFELDGTPQNCSVYYNNQEEANAFFFSLKTLYQQLFSIDHKNLKDVQYQ